jgi:hypothetical protein
MKTTVVVCCLIVLAGCGKEAGDGSTSAKPVVKGDGTMDSPIIISDGSTHLRHKAGTSNSHNPDFTTISPKIFAVVAASTASVSSIEFVTGGGWTCSIQNPVMPWTLTVYSDAGTTKTLTLSSPNSPSTTIATGVFSNAVMSSIDNTDTSGGTSLDDTTSNIKQVSYTPSGGGSTTFTCSNPGHHSCVVKLHYGGN